MANRDLEVKPKMRLGFFIGNYDAGGSHTRDFIKSLANRNISIDYFLCNPYGFKGLDTFSFNRDNINVYFFHRRILTSIYSSSIQKYIIKFKNIIIYLNQYFSIYFLRLLYILKFKNKSMIVRPWVQNKTQDIINKNSYNCFIGIESMGLVYAGMMAQKYNVPYIYHSYELFSNEFPNGKGKQFIREFNLLKRFEKEYHLKAACTIIQDASRKECLYENNSIKNVPAYFMPISLMGENIYNRNTYFHDLFNIDRTKKIILQYGTIFDERYSMEIAKITENLPDDYILVMHGSSKNSYIHKMKKIIDSKKLFISRQLVAPEDISKLISSAYIGLSFYKTDDPNSALSNLSSHKLAHYTQCGLPIISNSSPAINKMLDKEKFGLYIDNTSDINQAVNKIDSNYQSYSAASHRAYSKYYNIDNYINQMIKLFK